MYKKTLLCAALAFTTISTLPVYAHSVGVTAENAVADTVITTKIKALYVKSPLANASKIKVTSINQNVVLSGHLKTNSQYERAITLADSVQGVKAINADNLLVKTSDAPLTDAYTTAKVKGKFLKEKLFGSKAIEYWPVKVETKDSVVYLTGKVKTAQERSNIVHLAKNVTGVKSVKSAVIIQ